MQLTFTIDHQRISDTLTQSDIVALERHTGISFAKLADDIHLEYVFFLCWRLWQRHGNRARRWISFDTFLDRYEVHDLHFDGAEPNTSNIDQIIDDWRQQ